MPQSSKHKQNSSDSVWTGDPAGQLLLTAVGVCFVLLGLSLLSLGLCSEVSESMSSLAVADYIMSYSNVRKNIITTNADNKPTVCAHSCQTSMLALGNCRCTFSCVTSSM